MRSIQDLGFRESFCGRLAVNQAGRWETRKGKNYEKGRILDNRSYNEVLSVRNVDD